MMKRTPGHHVIFGMYFEEPDIRTGLEYILEMLGLEPQPHARWKLGRTRRDERSIRAVHHHDSGAVFQDLAVKAASWPKPVGEVLLVVFSQLPLGTSFQALA